MRHRRAPRLTPAISPSYGPLPAIALLVVTSCVDVAWGNSTAGRTRESRREQFEKILVSLKTGPPADRLDAADSVRDLFRRVAADENEEDAPTPEEIAEAIIEAVAIQPDEFVSWSILDGLAYYDDPGLPGVFHAALESGSPNLRAIALRWLADHEDLDSVSLLEELWDGGVPDWACLDLMRALAHHKSSMHLADFLGLTADADPAVRIAAIEALGDLHDDAALPRLLDLARTGGRYERGPALEAIAGWTESDAAFAGILEASRPGERLQATALRLLGSFHRPEGDERLLQALAERGDPGLRLAAARALEESVHPDATGSLVALLTDPELRGQGWAVSDLFRILFNRDDAEALPRLQALVEAGDIDDLDGLEKLTDYLGRRDQSRHLKSVSFGCSFGPPAAGDPDTWHVVAPHGWRSVRCSERPGAPGESWLEHRILEGTRVTIESRFDVRGATWGSVDSHADYGCWVPMSYLERGGGTGQRALDPLALELDLPSDALETKTARRLVRAGTLEPFDADEGVVGVVLHPRPDGPSLEELAASIEDGPGEDAEEVLENLVLRVKFHMLREVEAPGDSEEDEEE